MSSETPPTVVAHTEVQSESRQSPEVPTTEDNFSTQQASDDSPEPQSTLTERFTEVEWTAIKAFRVGSTFYHCIPHFRAMTRVTFLTSLLTHTQIIPMRRRHLLLSGVLTLILLIPKMPELALYF